MYTRYIASRERLRGGGGEEKDAMAEKIMQVFYCTTCVPHRYDNHKHFTFIILIAWIIAFANTSLEYRCVKMCLPLKAEVDGRTDLRGSVAQQLHIHAHRKANQILMVKIECRFFQFLQKNVNAYLLKLVYILFTPYRGRVSEQDVSVESTAA